jgi:multimeric flavodoxin WrbA
MCKVIAINGSPRKGSNTAILLQHALDGAKSQGAETGLVHLIDFTYQGCISCFACKRKNSEFIGKCAINDDLSPVLELAMSADAIVLGSPIYVGDITGMMRSFIERLAFMNISYDSKRGWHDSAPKNCTFIYTMNAKGVQAKLFSYIYLLNTGILKRFGGTTTQLLSTDTYQFSDYSKYAASNFNEKRKRIRKDTAFPKDCSRAFAIGKSMTGI